MFKLIVTLCLVSNPYICKPPYEVLPSEGDIIGLTSCLQGGIINSIQTDPTKWFAKIKCAQLTPTEFDTWMAFKKAKEKR